MPECIRGISRALALNLAAAGAYVALSKQAELSFAWEGVAVTLWLPAGLANAAVLLHGPVLAPAVVVGNLLASACDPAGTCAASPAMVPVALAAAAQALLVRFALRRQRLLSDPLVRTPRLLRFLLWAGPAGCWPAAVTYVLVFHAAAGFPAAGLTRGLFWWVGDSLGSLVLLPLLLVLLPLGQPLWAERRGVLLGPLLALILLLGVVTFLGRELAEGIASVPELVEPLQVLRLVLSLTLLLVAAGGVGLLLHVSGMVLEQEKLLRRSRLAADAAGAVLHEVGQPLLRLHLLLDRLRGRLAAPATQPPATDELIADVSAGLQELDRIQCITSAIQDLTLAGLRDTRHADMGAAIQAVVSQLTPTLDPLDQQLVVDPVPPGLLLQAGRNQLEVALRNLLLNASHAAGESGLIRLSVERADHEVLLRVEDSGAGFDPRAMPTGADRMASSWGGQGLGLMIVRRVVDEAEGSLSVARSAGLGGACVELRLPLAGTGPERI
ncbi:ATP-binding protein [Cyanobium sp. CH-040]|uniref:ATP-binding protein n=1 Tax=Cyanobium sp. CH-040 TaxID=2823708 RepID=UPI0020CCE02C|nr:ATP-binding protein [Cyanobium sp. CH-040]MCP9927702.1 ATP-binding protein [Cyanobium sp. CH-040]